MRKILLTLTMVAIVSVSCLAQTKLKPDTAKADTSVKHTYTATLPLEFYNFIMEKMPVYRSLITYNLTISDQEKIAEQKKVDAVLVNYAGRVHIDSAVIKPKTHIKK